MSGVRALFLHGGPGASAIPERTLYGDTLGIHWWTQPRPEENAAHPYEDVVVAAKRELTRTVNEAGEPVRLYANSSGALLALRLANEVPQMISGLTLLGPTHDPRESLIRLGTRLAELSVVPGVLHERLEAIRKHPLDTERLWALLQSISEVPNFMDIYWGPGSEDRGRWFAGLFADPAVFDFSVFLRLLNALLGVDRFDPPVRSALPVVAFLGAHDPLIDVDREARWWRERFPAIEIRVVQSGHYPHLELPSATWTSK